MTRKRTITNREKKQDPGIQVKFKGEYHKDYFEVHTLARKKFDTTGTDLVRRIVHDWLKQYGTAFSSQQEKIEQRILNLA